MVRTDWRDVGLGTAPIILVVSLLAAMVLALVVSGCDTEGVRAEREAETMERDTMRGEAVEEAILDPQSACYLLGQLHLIMFTADKARQRMRDDPSIPYLEELSEAVTRSDFTLRYLASQAEDAGLFDSWEALDSWMEAEVAYRNAFDPDDVEFGGAEAEYYAQLAAWAGLRKSPPPC